ncbi:MAG TPA: type II toxin-antitoxin system death-on-curing family toxin [Myxococcales bacterium]
MNPRFLTLAEIEWLHALSIDEFGGGNGLRDGGAFESAANQARATFGGEFLHHDLFEMAAAYAFHIAQNQPFVDGNKRTGVLAAVMFLTLNGVEIVDPAEKLYDAMIAIAERRMDKLQLAHLFRELGTARSERTTS